MLLAFSFQQARLCRGPVRMLLALSSIRCAYWLRIFSGWVTVRRVCAGSCRRMCILVVFDDMFRVYTCTRTVFEQVLPPIVVHVRCMGITLLESDRG